MRYVRWQLERDLQKPVKSQPSLRFQWWCSNIHYSDVTLDCFQILSLFCLLTMFSWIVFECLNFSLFAILSFDTHIWMVASFRAVFLHLYDVGLAWHQLWSKICVLVHFTFTFFLFASLFCHLQTTAFICFNFTFSIHIHQHHCETRLSIYIIITIIVKLSHIL